MASIDTLRASDGSGNASVATIQNPRSSAATTLVVDTVQGINGKFHATMGTPHTFVDPVTSETITVISEATAVDFQGHVDGTNLEIDTIAPGYTDNGSQVNDIVIIKPTTQWADEVADVLDVSHDDDGTLKDDAVSTNTIQDNAVTNEKLAGGITADKLLYAPYVMHHIFANSTGSQTITGVPFKPRAIITFSGISGASTTTSLISNGAASDNGGTTVQGAYAINTSGGVSASSSISDGAFLSVASNNSWQFRAAVTSWNANGITVNVSHSSSATTPRSYTIVFFP